ncbi:MAG: hypothetical protein V5A57_02215 [Candidatus Paceibacterota bacterium]
MNKKRLEVFLEFLIFGVAMGVAEDLAVVFFVTDEPFTWKILGIIFLVAVPFAIIGELIVDRTDWLSK